MIVLDRDLKPSQATVERSGDIVQITVRCSSDQEAVLAFNNILEQMKGGHLSISFDTAEAK